MIQKFIELSISNTHFVLPWDAPTVIHAIRSNNIDATQLVFASSLEKQLLSRDLFLLAAKDAVMRNVEEPSTLTLLARALMH